MRSLAAGTRLVGMLILTGIATFADGYAEVRAEARDGLVDGLVEHAEWCNKKKLHALRKETLVLVLEFDSDNKEARKGLGYKRQKDGSWKGKNSTREPKNYNDEALAEAPARRAEVVGVFSARLIAYYKQGGLSTEDQERLLEDIIYLDVDHPFVRDIRGEVKDGDNWVLRETVQARAGRARIREHVRDGYKNAKPVVTSKATDAERALGLGWSVVVENDVVRILSTGDRKECESLARAVSATKYSFEKVLGHTTKLPPQFTVYLLQNHGEGRTFLSNHPSVSDQDYERLAVLEGTGIQGTGDFAQWSEDPVRRRDAVVRFSIGWMTEVAFGVTPEEGWVYEGLGLYLGREFAGTRLTWFVTSASFVNAPEDTALRARLLDGKSEWMNEAYKTLTKPDKPQLSQVMGKTIDALTAADMLFAYVASAYLVETRSPAELSELLKSVGSGLRGPRAISKTLSISIDTMDKRVVRWLSERH